MEKSKITNPRPLNGLGDFTPTGFNGTGNEQDGLGLIEEITQAAGAVVSLLINVLSKPPSDAWSTYSNSDKNRYVKEALQISTTAVITNRALSVADTFRKFIARVELNENWEKWKKKNSRFLVSLFEAENEVSRYRRSGYQPGMQYINPRIIDRVLHPTPTKASIFSGKSSIIMLLVAIGGAAFLYKKLKQLN
jgi:hypothetical protein